VLLNIVKQAGQNYVSTSGFVSTTTGLLGTFCNQLTSTVNGLGIKYMSTGHFTSTVAGLATPNYVSIGSLVSSSIQYSNYENLQLQAMVNTPSNYVSTIGLVSTTTGLIGTFSNKLISTVTGIGLVRNGRGAVTTGQLASTVNGLGTSTYISIASLVSSSLYYVNYENIELQKFVKTSGSNVYTGYISTTGIVKFTTGFLNEYIGFFMSTLYGLKDTSYISTPQLFSTVNGLSSPTYISTPHLTSTTFGYSNIGKRQLIDMITNIGQTYISRGGLMSTTTGLLADYSNCFLSTIDGLGTTSYISTGDLVSTVLGVEVPPIPLPTFIAILSNLVSDNYSQLSGQLTVNSNMIIATYFPASGYASTTSGYLSNFSTGLTSTAVGLGTSGFLSSAQIVSTVNGLAFVSYISTASLLSTTAGLQANQLRQLQGFVSTPQVYISTPTLASTSTGMLSNFGVQLISTTAGLGSTYISTPYLVSTVQGLGLCNVSTGSMASTITSLTASYALSSITLFENNLSNYISTSGLVSTVVGLSNIYASGSNLQSTFAGLSNIGYITSNNVASTITGLSIQQSNALPLLTSTVAGLGQIYFSTLTQPLADSPALCNAVAYFGGGYINTLAAVPNGYVYSDSDTILKTTNFYETAKLSYSGQAITVTNTIFANIVRSIGFSATIGSGQYFTISSDSNLKQDIVPLSPSESLDQVMSMRGVSYKMIGDSTPYIGCIAQEVEEVFPEVITTHTGESNLKAMKYEFLLAPLVESVKELSHIHSTLKYFVRKNQGNIQ